MEHVRTNAFNIEKDKTFTNRIKEEETSLSTLHIRKEIILQRRRKKIELAIISILIPLSYKVFSLICFIRY